MGVATPLSSTQRNTERKIKKDAESKKEERKPERKNRPDKVPFGVCDKMLLPEFWHVNPLKL